MKIYIGSLAIWYGITTLILIFLPDSIGSLPKIDAIVAFNPRVTFAIAFGVSCMLCSIAVLTHYGPAIRLVTQAVSLSVLCAWTALLTLTIAQTGVGWASLLVWIWVIFVQAASVRYYDLPPIVEREMATHFKSVMERERTVEHARSGRDNGD